MKSITTAAVLAFVTAATPAAAEERVCVSVQVWTPPAPQPAPHCLPGVDLMCDIVGGNVIGVVVTEVRVCLPN